MSRRLRGGRGTWLRLYEEESAVGGKARVGSVIDVAQERRENEAEEL